MCPISIRTNYAVRMDKIGRQVGSVAKAMRVYAWLSDLLADSPSLHYAAAAPRAATFALAGIYVILSIYNL